MGVWYGVYDNVCMTLEDDDCPWDNECPSESRTWFTLRHAHMIVPYNLLIEKVRANGRDHCTAISRYG